MLVVPKWFHYIKERIFYKIYDVTKGQQHRTSRLGKDLFPPPLRDSERPQALLTYLHNRPVHFSIHQNFIHPF